MERVVAMNAEQLRGMAVVTVAGAERLGRVDDVVFETAPLKARALRLKTAVGEQLLLLSAVKSVGPDAITTDDGETAAAPGSAANQRDLRSLNELLKLKVVDAAGTYLGHIVRLDLDPSTGIVESVDVRKGQVLGIGGETTTLTADRILSVGAELITAR